MLPEGRFAVILGTIAIIFVFSLVGTFSFYIYNKEDSKFSEGYNIFKASGSGNQFKGLNKSVR